MKQKATYDPITKRFIVEAAPPGSKSTKSTAGLSTMSKEQLLEEGKRTCKLLYHSYNLDRPYTTYSGNMFSIWEDGDIMKGGRTRYRGGSKVSLDEIPVEVLRRIVSNGRDRVNKLDQEIDAAFAKYPEIVAAEAFEGKNKPEIIASLYDAKINELAEMFSGIYPEEQIYFTITAHLGAEKYNFTVRLGGGRYATSISCEPSYTAKEKLTFLNEFDTVKEKFIKQRRWFK